MKYVTLVDGDKYGEPYVTALRSRLPGLEVLREFPDLPLSGWWWKLWLFSPEVQTDDIVWLDLDTVLMTDDLSWFEECDRFMCLQSAWNEHEWGSGVMYIPRGTGHRLWQFVKRNPEQIMRFNAGGVRFGDQGVIRQAYEEGLIEGASLYRSMLQRKFPGKLRSYKKEVVEKGVDPYSADIVFFHGKPKPHEVDAPWIPEVLTQ